MEIRKNIDKTYIFNLPEIEIIPYKDLFLAVTPRTGNWLVLKNRKQVEFLSLLKGQSLGDALASFEGIYEDAREVITQIVAKHLEDTNTMIKTKESSMHLYLTNACNLKCPHCYMDSGEKLDKELSTEEIISLLTNFSNYGGKSVCLSGGEISLRKDLVVIIRHAYDLGIDVELLTNGVLWTNELINACAPYIKNVQISIDGYNEEENARIRGRGSFERALKTVERFLSQKIPTRVAITPMVETDFEKKAESYISFIKELYARYGEDLFSVTVSGDILDGRDMIFSFEEKNKHARSVEYIFQEVFNATRDDAFVRFHRELGIEDNCIYGNLVVGASGEVFACPAIGTLKPFANLRTNSFSEVMQLSEIGKRASHIDNVEPCKNCSVRYICGGGCRIKLYSHLESGSVCSNGEIPIYHCTKEIKYAVYEQMIRTHQQLYR